MEPTSLAIIVGSVFGAGGLAGVIPAVAASRRAAKQQPVDQWGHLAKHLQEMLEQERRHCDEKYDRLVAEHRECIQGHIELTGRISELYGRLDEQRHMLSAIVADTKANSTTIALMNDAGAKRKQSDSQKG